jgi:Tol biopolymer transport system component
MAHRHRIGPWAVLVGVLAASCSLGSHRGAKWWPGGVIVHEHDDRGVTQVVVSFPATGKDQVIAPSGYTPSLSPDGRSVAYQSAGAVHLVGVDGTGSRQLTFPTQHGGTSDAVPSWSPDGQWIAFYRFPGYQPASGGADRTGGSLRRIRPDGTDDQLIFGVPFGDDFESLSWSPDSTMIIGTQMTRGKAPPDIAKVVVIELPTGRIVQTIADLYWADWSLTGVIALYGAGPSVVLLTFATGERREVQIPGADVIIGATWSPDGARLLVEDFDSGLFVYEVSTGQTRRLEGVDDRWLDDHVDWAASASTS